eukprot:9487569-Pyramimonas_sp.AAC.1
MHVDSLARSFTVRRTRAQTHPSSVLLRTQISRFRSRRVPRHSFRTIAIFTPACGGVLRQANYSGHGWGDFQKLLCLSIVEPWPPQKIAGRRTQTYAAVNTAIVNILFGRAPNGATKRYTGWGERMLAVALGPSVELPMGSRSAVLGGGDACGR